MNGTELRSFSHFQILTWIAYSDHSRNLENWLILKFVFIHYKTVKVSVRWSNWNVNMIYKCFLDEYQRIKKFYLLSNFPLDRIKYHEIENYLELCTNLQIDWYWSLCSFTVKLWKSVKIFKFKCKDDLQVLSWWM